MSVLPNYDYDTENSDLQRRLQLLQALGQSSLNPNLPTQPGVKYSPLSAIADVAKAYLAGKGMDAVKGQQTELANRYRADARSGVQELIDAMGAQPGAPRPGTAVPAAPVDGMPDGRSPSAYEPPQAGMTPAEVAAKKQQAIMNAMVSNHPVLQQIGQSYLGQMQKQGLSMKDIFDKADEKTQQWMLQNPGVLPPNFSAASEYGSIPAGDTVINKKNGQIGLPQGVAPAQPGGVPGAPVDPSQALTPIFPVPQGMKLVGVQNGMQHLQDAHGDLFQQSAAGIKKIDQAPKTTVNTHTTVQAGESSFSKTLGEDTAKGVIEVRKGVDTARALMPMLDKFDQINKAGTYDGPQANAAIFAGELAKSMGMPVDQAKLQNSEEYRQTLQAQISKYLTAGAGVGRSLTDADREALMAQFPQLSQTTEGRARIIANLRKAAQNDIDYGANVEARLGKQFPELGRVLQVAPTNVSRPSGITPGGPTRKPTIVNW